jgi:hypothetical protein
LKWGSGINPVSLPFGSTASLPQLKNRDPAHWRDAWQVDHTLGKYISLPHESALSLGVALLIALAPLTADRRARGPARLNGFLAAVVHDSAARAAVYELLPADVHDRPARDAALLNPFLAAVVHDDADRDAALPNDFLAAAVHNAAARGPARLNGFLAAVVHTVPLTVPP